jgi:tetratricopeptide (TPR) repeat protein
MARRLEVTDTIEAQRELLSALAETYERELDEWEPALDAYKARRGSRRRAPGDLRRDRSSGERLGHWDVAAEAARKWADTCPRTRARWRRWRRVRRHNGELEAALHLFLDAAERETTGTAQAALLSEAALIVQGGLGKDNRQSEQAEEEQATELYVRALAADPDHAPAAERLAEIYATRGRWADVEELLDVVIDGLEPGETDRLVALEMKLAEACIQLGKTDKNKMDKALDSLARAHEARAESLPVLHKYGDLRMQRREWKDALNMYEAILRDQRQTLSPAETAEIAMQIGACHVELGNQDRALAAYLEAKTFDPSYRPALDALAAAYAAKEDWVAWVAERRQLADIAEPEEKAGLEEEIGDAYADKLSDAEKAEACYRAALELEPARRSTLHKLLDVYTKSQRWQPGDRSAQPAREGRGGPGGPRAHPVHSGADPARRAEPARRGRVAAGALPRRGARPDRGLRGSRGAAQGEERLEGARAQLPPDDQAPAQRGAAPAPPQPVDAPGRHRDQAAARSQAGAGSVRGGGGAGARRRLPAGDAGPPLRAVGNRNARASDRVAPAVARARPASTDSYRALAKLYGDGNELDKQWCVASALYYLKKADPTIDAIFRRHRPTQIRLPQRPFTEEIWQRVAHPDEDRLLSALFAVAAPYLSAPIAKSPADMGLGRRHRIDLALDRTPPVLAVIQLAEVMGCRCPSCSAARNENAQTVILNLQYKGRPKTALALRPSTQRRNSFDLVFDLAGQMAFLRPERILRFAFGTPAAIELGMRAALGLGAPLTGVYAANPELNQMLTVLRRTVAPPVVSAIGVAGRALTEARGDTIDVTKWLAATHLTAARTALVMTGDLGAAAA